MVREGLKIDLISNCQISYSKFSMLVYGVLTMNSLINVFEISHLNTCDLDIVSSVADRDFRL